MKTYTFIGAIFFLIIGVLHLFRALHGVQITIGTYTVPVWISYVGFVVPVLIGIMMFREMKR